MNNFAIRSGFDEKHRLPAAELYMDAFGSKIGGILGRGHRGQAFIASMLQSSHAISAGFKTDQGSFVGGELSDLTSYYGWFGGVWRGLTLSVLERETEAGCLLMDGICVSKEARGKGIGTALLDAISEMAKERGLREVRLDVIDSNPRAKALYTRRGFVEGKTTQMGPLKYVFGFKSATTMRLAV